MVKDHIFLYGADIKIMSPCIDNSLINDWMKHDMNPNVFIQLFAVLLMWKD